MNEVVIDDSQREMCAVLVMRTMLTDYCNDTGVSFNDVFFRFVTSPAYKMTLSVLRTWKSNSDSIYPTQSHG